MDFERSDDQVALVDAVRAVLAGRFPMDAVRALEAVGGMDRDRWRELGNLGVFTIGPGGLGGADAVLVFEQLGHALVPGPLVASTLASHLIPGAAEGGRVVGTVARAAESPTLIEYFDVLDDLLVYDDDGLWWIDPRSVDAAAARPLDPLTPVSRVERLPLGEQITDAMGAARWRVQGAILTSALQLGLAAGACDLATAYAKERRQFDKPIGQFQAVKHLCADMASRVEVCRAIVYFAGVCLDDPDAGDLVRAAAAARVLAVTASGENARECVQVHGGMGYTWEVDAHLFAKRAYVLATAFGAVEEHEEALAELVVTTAPNLRLNSRTGHGVLAAAVLASGVAFLDGTVVNAALPAIANDLDASLTDLQWVVTAYLLTLGAFLVLGGSLGDHFGRRRILVIGLLGFVATSMVCGLAPSTGVLIGARALQGVAGALMIPGSLAIVSASFHPVDRGRAIGAWSGLSGVSLALGPFLGGWLIDAFSWRLVFFINVPFVAVTVLMALRFVPETRDPTATERIDWLGGAVLVLGLAAGVYALIEGPSNGWTTGTVFLGALGVVALVAFVRIEMAVANPMVPMGMFRSRQFSGANAVTLLVYAALSGVLFLLVVHLQTDMGYSALEAGASLLPVTACMLLFSPRAGALSQRIGPRVPMTIGPMIAGAGMALLALAEPGRSYWLAVFPGTIVLGIGLTTTVAPLTTAVLAAAGDQHAGIGSAINNAVSRVAGLLSIAILPAVAGLTTGGDSLDLAGGFGRAMVISGVTCAAGGLTAAFLIRTGTPTRLARRADLSIPCPSPCLAEMDADAA